jgi:hypothetical protein
MFASQMSGGKWGKLLPAVRQGHADPEGNIKKKNTSNASGKPMIMTVKYYYCQHYVFQLFF